MLSIYKSDKISVLVIKLVLMIAGIILILLVVVTIVYLVKSIADWKNQASKRNEAMVVMSRAKIYISIYTLTALCTEAPSCCSCDSIFSYPLLR